MMDVHSEIGQVSSREDLSAFVRTLKQGLVDGTVKFDNHDLPSYLEAMSGWIEDMDGYFQNRGEEVPEQPSWRTVAQILTAAAIYE